MPQDLSSKKKEFFNQAVAYASKAEALTRDIVELVNYWTDNGFASGGGNPVTQSDIDAGGGSASHLTPAMLASFITAISNVNLSPAQRTTMRQVSGSTIPSQ